MAPKSKGRHEHPSLTLGQIYMNNMIKIQRHIWYENKKYPIQDSDNPSGDREGKQLRRDILKKIQLYSQYFISKAGYCDT